MTEYPIAGSEMWTVCVYDDTLGDWLPQEGTNRYGLFAKFEGRKHPCTINGTHEPGVFCRVRDITTIHGLELRVARVTRMDRYGELRPMAGAIRRELNDDR